MLQEHEIHHFTLEITPLRTGETETFIATGRDDGSLGWSNSRTFNDDADLLAELDALGIFVNAQDTYSLYMGESINLTTDPKKLRLLGVWEPKSQPKT
jgi:hypothetical protein